MEAHPEPDSSGSTNKSMLAASALRELLQAEPVHTLCVDDTGNMLWVSHALAQAVGQDPSTLIGQPFDSLVAPAQRRATLKFFAVARRAGLETCERLVPLAGPGARAWFRVRRVTGANGEAVYVALGREVGALADQAARLRDQVTTLRAARARAVGSAALNEDCLTILGHELRTPMNGIRGMTQLLLDTELDLEQRHLVAVIQNSSHALVNLVNDTLEFSRLDAGHTEIETMNFDLRVMMEEVATLLRPLAETRSLRVGCEVHHEVPSRLRSDPGRLRHILTTLAHNALHHAREGDLELRVERAGEDEQRVALRFSVVDRTGAIPEDQRADLEQSLRSSDPSSARRFGGRGFGHAVVARIATLLGGTLSVTCDPSIGTTFTFDVSLAKQQDTPALSEHRWVDLDGLHALVVNPSPVIREPLVAALAEWGCTPEQAASGTEAITALRRAAAAGAPHRLVLVDTDPGDLSPEQLGEAVRGDAALDGTALMLITGVGRRGDGVKMRASGYAAYLVKPVEWAELNEALLAVLQTGARGAATALVTRHSLAEARRGRTRILFAEANPMNQMVADWSLRRLGYAVQVVSTLAEAAQALAHQHYDLVLLDVHMAGMDGGRAVVDLRAAEREGERIPFVAMAADAGPGDLSRYRAAGLDDVLSKPVDPALLCATVERWTRPVRLIVPGVEAPQPAPELSGAESPHQAPPSAPVAAVSRPTPASAAPAPVADARVRFDATRLEAACMGLPVLRDALLATFRSEAEPRLVLLEQALAAGDADRVESVALGVRELCTPIGALACADAFGVLETLARSGDLPAVAAQVSPAARCLQETLIELEELQTRLRAA